MRLFSVPNRLSNALVVCGLMLAAAAPAAAGTTRRPVTDFVNAQGQFPWGGPGTQQVPPVDDFIGFTDPARGLAISFDYAGLADDALGGLLGTTFSGTITERPLADGRCLVHVVLHVDDALAWVIPFDFDPNNTSNQFGENPLAFGARFDDIVAGAAPAVGSGTLTIDFIAAECGAPMPDLIQLAVAPEEGQELLSLHLAATVEGQVPDGTAGKVHVTEVGMLDKTFGSEFDFFPVENIIFTGR